MRTRICTIVSIALLAAACGTSSSPLPDGGTDAAEDCAAAELRAAGSLDGEPADLALEVAGAYLVNEGCGGAEVCYLNLYIQGGGRLRLEWDAPLELGQSAAAAGSLNLAAQGGPNAGNCSGDLASELTLGELRVDFRLRGLHAAPYCSGASVEGEISGCATWQE
ncbi:MAG: hypothetical protein JXR96_09115 [Deltaproteobacteria bacterium]|nr:hypothetical protein [Deltaproteobacteria bacterium]